MALDDAAHDRRRALPPRALLVQVVLVAVGLVDDLFGDNFFNDVFEGDDAERTAGLAGSVADEQEVGTTGLARKA